MSYERIFKKKEKEIECKLKNANTEFHFFADTFLA